MMATMFRFMNAFTLPAIVLVLFQLSLLPTSSANPSQAGHCNKGSIADQPISYTGPHNKAQGGGSLENGSYQLTIDGNAMDIFESNSFIAGKEYKVRLETLAPENMDVGYFKGVLIRLDTMIVSDDVSADYFTAPTGGGIRKHPFCEAADVPAVTHNSAVKKTFIEFTIMVPEPISGLRLDTTVVRNKEDGGSNWFYDMYTLDFSAPPSPCIEKSGKLFYVKTKKNGKIIDKNCNWLSNKKGGKIKSICAMTEADGTSGLAKDVCQVTCGTCPSGCSEAYYEMFFYKMQKGKPVNKDCQWLAKQKDAKISKICTEKLESSDDYPPAMIACPVTCKSCE